MYSNHFHNASKAEANATTIMHSQQIRYNAIVIPNGTPPLKECCCQRWLLYEMFVTPLIVSSQVALSPICMSPLWRIYHWCRTYFVVDKYFYLLVFAGSYFGVRMSYLRVELAVWLRSSIKPELDRRYTDEKCKCMCIFDVSCLFLCYITLYKMYIIFNLGNSSRIKKIIASTYCAR